MGAYYFDSSALIKRYITEPGSAWVQTICDPTQNHQIFVARITSTEMLSALAKSYRMQIMNEQQLMQLASLVLRDIQRQYQQVPMHPSLYHSAGKFIITYAIKGLRAYDAIQLACALYANQRFITQNQATLTFVTSDAILRAVAETAGLHALDPISASDISQ